MPPVDRVGVQVARLPCAVRYGGVSRCMIRTVLVLLVLVGTLPACLNDSTSAEAEDEFRGRYAATPERLARQESRHWALIVGGVFALGIGVVGVMAMRNVRRPRT